jgi:hypothetical protein
LNKELSDTNSARTVNTISWRNHQLWQKHVSLTLTELSSMKRQVQNLEVPQCVLLYVTLRGVNTC